MAINLATVYEKKLAELYSLVSKTDAYIGKDYNFIGAKSIEVITADTVAITDYTRSGTSRYGTVTELGDTKQTMTMNRDRSFTFSIDEANASEQFNIKQATRMLQNEWKLKATPEIDAYRLWKWATGNGLSAGNSVLTNATAAALTKANILEAIFTASATMSDKAVPTVDRVLFIHELEYLKFKIADLVIGGAQLNQEAISKGYRGTLDGIHVVTVPSSYMPTNVGFIIKHKSATVDPMKLKNLRVQKHPMGVDGDVVEGHFMYDAFVLDAKKDGMFVYKTASGAIGMPTVLGTASTGG